MARYASLQTAGRRTFRLLLLLPLIAGCGRSPERVVLYCGQDREFAEGVLDSFTRQTGINVDLRCDTEADKSVSLYEAIVRESRHPRCDVFWNGEVLNTVRLEGKDLLASYASPSAAPYPEWTKSPNHTWHLFAARARVLIVNRKVPPGERPKSILDLTTPRWKGKVAIAKPMFGTTATHAACLFQVLGEEKAEKFFEELKETAAILPGNKDVAVAVAEGRYDAGFTDTDDAIIEVNRGAPVDIIYPDQEGMGTLFIPNSVAIIKGGPNPATAQKLVDYLLSAKVEAQLAAGRSAQIPLNPEVKVALPIKSPVDVKPMSVDFAAAAASWESVQEFLRSRFARD